MSNVPLLASGNSKRLVPGDRSVRESPLSRGGAESNDIGGAQAVESLISIILLLIEILTAVTAAFVTLVDVGEDRPSWRGEGVSDESREGGDRSLSEGMPCGGGEGGWGLRVEALMIGIWALTGSRGVAVDPGKAPSKRRYLASRWVEKQVSERPTEEKNRGRFADA